MKTTVWSFGMAACFLSLAAVADTSGWVLNAERSSWLASGSDQATAALPPTAKANLMLVSTGIAPKGHRADLALRNDLLSYNADIQFAAKLNGLDFPVRGLEVGDSIAIALEDDQSVVSTIKSAGNKVASFKRSLGSNPKTMVVTARYFGKDGRVTGSERLVFELR